MQEYSFKFTQLSKYAPSLVSNPRHEMSWFVTRISYPVKQECRSDMIHDEINISRLMVNSQSMESLNLRQRIRNLIDLGPVNQFNPSLREVL